METKPAFPKLLIQRKSGQECFHSHGKPLDRSLFDFWQWANSDLVSNAARGVLAEYIVALALGIDLAPVRNEWDSFDLQTSTGEKVEVKSAAYIQTWNQKEYSKIKFDIPETYFVDPETGVQSKELKRQADYYVFALLAHRDQTSIDPLDLDQWRFYILPATVLNSAIHGQKSISLRSLERLCSSPVAFGQLAEAFREEKKSITIGLRMDEKSGE